MIQTASTETRSVAGADLFVEYDGQPSQLADSLNKLIDSRLSISTISNRGTQVWPTGSLFTNCVDQYRVRLEAQNGVNVDPADLFELCKKINPEIRICSIEMLLEIDGKKAYSLAQGQ